MKLHIGIVGPIATADISHLIQSKVPNLPVGYEGAPLLATLIAELLRQGHRVSAFTLTSDLPLDGGAVVVRGNNFSLTYCPMRPHAWRPNGLRSGRILDLFGFEREQLRKAILQVAPDVVHAHWTYEFSLAAMQTGLPHVVTCHDSPYKVARFYSREKPTQSLYRWLRALMARKVLSQAQCVTAVSPYMQDEVQSMTRMSISVVPNPVDVFALDLNKSRTAPSSPRFAMVCNGWQSRKNPQPAMQAFAMFRAAHPAVEFHLYGHDFGVGQAAEIWAKQQGIATSMVFHGALPHKQLLQALSIADLLLHPALEESFGMSIAEAMAMGLPIVAGESSGAVHWVVGGGGVLCDVRQEQSIYDAIEHALIPENYVRYSLAARARIETMFTASAVASAYLATYQTAIEKERVPC
jgi:glycosyltransferase involved in cell wall biosynthesis